MASHSLQVSPLGIADLDAVVNIERACHSNPWSRDAFATELGHPWSHIVGAWARTDPTANLVGFVLYWIVADELQIMNVATHPDHRRQGVGRTLLERVLAIAGEGGVFTAWLEVGAGNRPARALYDLLGFAPAALRRGYYADGDDAVIMRRMLVAGDRRDGGGLL